MNPTPTPAPDIDALLKDATPGPWEANKWATGYTVSAPESHYSVCHLENCNNDEANARLIAVAPQLASDNQRLKATLADACTQIDGLREALQGLLSAPSGVARPLSSDEVRCLNDAVNQARNALKGGDR